MCTLTVVPIFPEKKALEVNWNIGSDRLGFKLNLDVKTNN